MVTIVSATDLHRAAIDDFTAVAIKHAEDLSADELVAVAANFLGRLMQLPELRSADPEGLVNLVNENLARGSVSGKSATNGSLTKH